MLGLSQISHLVLEDVILQIHSLLPPNANNGDDRRVWCGSGRGNFVVASFYSLLDSDHDSSNEFI